VRDLNADFVFSAERQGMRVLNVSETLPTVLGNQVNAIVSGINYIKLLIWLFLGCTEQCFFIAR